MQQQHRSMTQPSQLTELAHNRTIRAQADSKEAQEIHLEQQQHQGLNPVARTELNNSKRTQTMNSAAMAEFRPSQSFVKQITQQQWVKNSKQKDVNIQQAMDNNG